MLRGSLLFLILLGLACRNSPDSIPEKPVEAEDSSAPILLDEPETPEPEATESDKPEEPDSSNDVTEREEPQFLLSDGEGFPSINEKFRVLLKWEETPRAGAYSNATLTVSLPDGRQAESVKIESIEVWMKIHGHGLGNYQPVIKQDEDRNFIITVREIYFIMGGPWELNLTLTVDGETDFLEYRIEVEG